MGDPGPSLLRLGALQAISGGSAGEHSSMKNKEFKTIYKTNTYCLVGPTRSTDPLEPLDQNMNILQIYFQVSQDH